MKNNKAHGDDHVINEYIISTSDKLIDVYIELFNIIFETGIILDSWLVGYIKSIYTNKGDKLDPKHFRPITILSCVSKLFTAILNESLNKLSGDFFILCKNQTGFWKGYSTIDNLFIVHCTFLFWNTLKEKEKNVLLFHRFWKSIR